jgi:GTP-binding protein Era
VKAGHVALVGRPNAGKSTLVNHFVGQKVAIVSNKPQTTRHRIVGVRTTAAAQMVFLDTPGIHKPVHRMNQRMVDAAYDALRDADVVVWVVDATARPGAGDAFVLQRLRSAAVPIVLAINKIDLVRKQRLLPIIEHFSAAMTFHAVVPISARTADGLPSLETEIASALPEGALLFPEEYVTDQTERGLTAEMIREKVLLHTRDELPYSVAVTIDQFEEPSERSPTTRIFASILVDADSQKPIVVGRGGEMIKRIGSEARRDLEAMLGGPVFLDLHVKVREDWRDNERLLDELGVGSGPAWRKPGLTP